MRERRFELRIFERKVNETGLAFHEQPSDRDKTSRGNQLKELRVWGLPLKVMTETLLRTLKKQGYRPTALSSRKKEPFLLDEASGVRLGLFLFALKPLRKVTRMEEIITGIERMSDEEVYYWYAKCTNGRNAPHARKALRILLSGE